MHGKNKILSVTGIAKLEKLEYVNLDDNQINRFQEKDFAGSNLKQISMQNNQISDLSPLAVLDEIEYLNLANNQISEVEPIEEYSFSKGLDLRNQKIELALYKKTYEDDHYVILPGIMQCAKDSHSKVYAPNAEFIPENAKLNTDSAYQTSPNYNVIISKDKTSNDNITVTVKNGGVIDGTTISYKIGSGTSAIDTVKFEDTNLDKAMYQYTIEKLIAVNRKVYLKRAPLIININRNEIATSTQIDLSSLGIQNLKGIGNYENFTDLNLADNKISNDSEIKWMTKMQTLNLANNNLNNNYSSIENLYSLTSLNISGNKVKDIDSIENLKNNIISKRKTIVLSELTLANNEISDISRLSDITSLKKLNVSNNRISDIGTLKSNSLLELLNVSDNNIEDISVVSNLKSIMDLNIANNNIENIAPIVNLSLLIFDGSGNKISDITPLQTQTRLTNLIINNNKIDDISKVEGLLTKGGFEAKQQKIVHIIEDGQTGTMTIQLPNIFKSSRQENSKIYTSSDFELHNCELGEDGESVKIDLNTLGNKIAVVAIQGGLADRTTFSIAKGLEGTIDYNISTRTNRNVVATISFNRENVTVLNNNGNKTYEFTQNGEFTFRYIDEYGFESQKTAKVTWIDREGPKATVTYSTQDKTKEDVVVTITTDEKVANSINGWEFKNEEHTILTKTYSENVIKETVNLQDDLGNISKVDISVTNIDKTEEPPTAEIIKGDLNGDGRRTLADVSILRKHILKIQLINDSKYKEVADLNGDGKITLADVSILRKVILNIQSI